MLPPLLNNQKGGGGRKHFYFHPTHTGKRYFAKIEETNDN